MTGFDKPNYTETPNMLFDDLMKDMSEAELKVTLSIVRQTFGYHKKSDPISLTQLERMTGLSRTACQSGVDAVIKRGLVIRSTGKRNVSIYTLVVKDNQYEIATSTSSELLPVTSSNLLHTKESIKESIKEESRKRSTPASSIHPLIQAWATVRGIDTVNIGAPIYSAKDTTLAKRMAKWELPPTDKEIEAAVKASKVDKYPFMWLEQDIPKMRLDNTPKPVPPKDPNKPMTESEYDLLLIKERQEKEAALYGWS